VSYLSSDANLESVILSNSGDDEELSSSHVTSSLENVSAWLAICILMLGYHTLQLDYQSEVAMNCK